MTFSIIQALYVLSAMGFLISAYVYYTYRKMTSDKKFRPYCDINSKVVCSASVMSPYGKTVGVHNGIWGMLFYLLVLLAVYLGNILTVFILSVVAVLISCRLACILYFKLKKVCINCFMIYVVNISLLISSAFLYF